MASLVPCDDPGRGRVAHDRPADLSALLQLPDVPHTGRPGAEMAGRKRPGRGRSSRPRRAAGAASCTASDEFQYSLRPQPRDLGLDPVEDFVLNNPSRALRVFCRRVGVDAPQPGDSRRGWSSDTRPTSTTNAARRTTCGSADAHAWVEAYLAPEKVPPSLRWGDAGRWTRGAWLRLDPTPAADADAGLLVRKIGAAADWIESFWSDYVMDMDRQRQNEAIYAPLFKAIREYGDKFRESSVAAQSPASDSAIGCEAPAGMAWAAGSCTWGCRWPSPWRPFG